MNKPFDPTKPYTYRNGESAKILYTGGVFVYNETPQPIISEDVAGHLHRHGVDGQQFPHGESNFDLINIPEPKKWRAWKCEEFPLGAVFRHGDDGTPTNWVDIKSHGVTLGLYSCDGRVTSWKELFEDWTHSLDHGKTWHGCGVEE